MRTRSLILLLCLLCLAGAWLLWPRPVNTQTRPSALQKVAAPAVTTVRSASTAPNILTPVYTNSAKPGTVLASTNKFALRLSNTSKSLDQLMGDRHAILLENALIDTGSPLNFSIPTHLQSQGDPGAYIVQARGPIDNAFRAMLAAAGAEIVSYIPNDAYLVRAQAGVANGLASNPLTQAVMAYEPYYKIQSSMLTLAVGQMALPDGAALNLGLFGDNAQQTIQEIEKLGGKVLAQDRSPFGPVVRVQPPQNWTMLAALPGVQRVEPYHPRMHANDLSRVAVGVSTDTLVPTNYMNLSGLNVIVEVNDFGIDANHPDFAATTNGGASRVIGDPANLVDSDGRGTHVAGIIAGNGSKSSTVTNAPGSVTNANFRGKAQLATLLSMNLNLSSDRELQEAAARTNALISNNSWNYGNSAYDLAAASYDAAVRDALPEVTGSQPVLFVFAAGNSGNGDNSSDPGGGIADTIQSPATAKNVITVGALQEFRNITNKVITISASGVTNTGTPWQPETSTSFRMTGFSSRGNVGIGIEGTYGRYKPDVVAPGTFVISTRSAQWDIVNYFYINPTNHTVNTFGHLVVQPGSLWANVFPVIPNNTVQAAIYVRPNANSPVPFPDLPIYFGLLSSPAYTSFTTNNQVTIPPDGGLLTIASILSSQTFYGFNYGVSNSTANPINFSLTTDIVTTNNPGDYFLVLSNLNQSIGEFNLASTGPGPYYRYESGTSMSAADVSGVLALMQDYFTNTLHTTPSPVLLKAMLINGARATGFYNFQAQNSINAVPPGITNQLSAACASYFADQNPTNALATSDSHTYHVTVASAAAALPLRITLAWTDPPGDPAAAIKLVNDLNLVVTNLDNPTNSVVYYGNDIPASSTFNSAQNPTNAAQFDAINNVENVYLSPSAGTNFAVTILGYRVNVNAVTAHTNNVVQDFALVISSGNGEVTNAFTVTDIGLGLGIVSNPTTDQQITFVTSTNKPLLNQLVGASTPLLGTNTIPLGTNLVWGGSNGLVTLGMTNQWHFYVVTNTTGFTNAAFITFIPDTLSIPRMGVFADSTANATRPEADIDLYVTTDPTLMNLNPVAISNCVHGAQVGASVGNSFNGASLGRGGTEFVVDTNSSPSIPGEVYYVGVYSEDQEASEYGFIPIFSQQPFSQMNPNGSQSVFGVPLPVDIPDGTPAHPGSGYVFGVALYPMQVQQVVVNNLIAHQNFGDLIGTLTHGGNNGLSGSIVLNNHDSLYNSSGIYTQIYDDSGQNNIIGSQLSDGPGSLNTFTGQQGNGVWLLTETDDSLTQIGSVTGFNMLVEPHHPLDKGITTILGPLGWFYEYIDVPPGATNLTIYATNLTGTGQVDLFVKVGARPTLTDTNEFGPARLTNNGSLGLDGSISIGPPLVPGRYWVGLYNESLVPQTVYVIAKLGMGAVPGQVIFSSSGPAPILDDAVMTNSIFVTANQVLSSVEAALRVDHPRVSDLVFHLISPDGTRCLLVENRGGTTTNGMGATLAFTNITPASSSGDGSASTNVIDTGQTAGTVQISYNFYTQPDQMLVQYQGANIFDSGIVNGSGVFNVAYGPGANTQLTVIMNPTVNPGPGDLWDYTVNSAQAYYTYLVLTENTNKTTTPIKYAVPPFHGILTNMLVTNAVLVTNLVPVTNAAVGWYSGFEGAIGGTPMAGSYFAGGWFVNSGSVDVLPTGVFGSTAYIGTNYIDINGNNQGTISTNVPTLSGQTYQLSFAYAQNPLVRPTVAVQLQANGSPVLTLTINNPTNTWAGLGWATTSFLFTATSPSTLFTFASQTPGSGGVLLDAIDLAPLSGANGFERAAAGDYAQSHYFDGWYVIANQVTVISNATLAYSGTNLLALADGVISRLLPTVPGQTYTLTYAYRGPGAVALWRAESNTVDSVNGNNPVAVQSITYHAGEVGQAFHYDGSTSLITVPASTSLAVSNLTIESWIFPTDSGTPLPIIDYGGAGVLTPIMLWINTTGGTSVNPGALYGVIRTQNNTGYIEVKDANPIVTVNQWNHVAFTVNATTLTGILYCNGVQVGSATTIPIGSPVTPINFGNAPVNIGYRDVNSLDIMPGMSFLGNLDEVSIYNRDLSASEIQAIFQKGISGKYNTNAPSIAAGLAEAQVTVVGVTNFPPFFGSNTNWQTTNITFTATLSNTVLQIIGIEPGMLLDNFALTQPVVSTNYVVTTNLSGSDVYYLPEQSLDTFAGLNANGPWKLEVWDNRAGAGLTNTLVSWQLRFNFPTTVSSIGSLTNGTPQTNVIPIGSIAYYLVTVPINADIATNILISPNGPLNLWFDQVTPPTGAGAGDYLLLGGSTNGTAILYTNGTPPLVPGSTYYLGVQNTNTFAVTNYSITVDFHLIPVPIVLTNGQPQTNTVPAGGIDYYLVNVPTNADWATNLLLFADGPLNVWFNPTNLPAATNPPDILLFGGATNGISIFGTNSTPTNIVPGGSYYLAVQNTNSIAVTYAIEVDFHTLTQIVITNSTPITNSIPTNGMTQVMVVVPTNAIWASNILISATGPLNVWFNQTNPPTGSTNTGDFLMFSATNAGVFVLTGSSVPPLVPGTNYFLGFQNLGTSNVTFVFQVVFGFAPINPVSNFTITATNIGGTNGFLLQWQGPTNFQYEIQWTTNLAPVVWNTVLNPVINVVVTSTNGHYSFFDDGTLTGGFGPMKFYRVLGGLNLGPITGPGPATNTVLAGAMSQAVVAVPTNAISASNLLISATGPLNVWFNQTNPPTGNTNAGDFLMLSATSAGTFVLTSNSVPPLVPGTNYFLGFQNPGASNVTFVFQVVFGFAPTTTNAVSNLTITATNGGIWLKWNGLTNYQYQVQWRTNLLPPAAWNTISNIVLTSTTGIFTFFDDGSLTGGFGPMKFYRLIAWPFMTPIPQTLSISSVTVTNIAGTNDLVLRWSAPTNYQYGIRWTTNLTLPFSNWFIIASPVLTLTNGVYTFIDNGQTGPPASAKFFRLVEYP
jgi:subtilisin-like proprotein convertase family protein